MKALSRWSAMRRRWPALTAAAVTVLAVRAAVAAPAAAPPQLAPAAPRAAAVPRGAAVEAAEVLRAADAVAQSLAATQRIPAGDVVTLKDGSARALSAAQLFVLLARFLGNGREQGVTPDHAPCPPRMAGPLETSSSPAAPAREVVIPAVDLLAQARVTADVAEATGSVPSGVWVQGLRLSPAQYMGALATMLQHAATTGAVPEQVAVGNYLPPLDWTVNSAAGGEPAAPPPDLSAAPAQLAPAPVASLREPVMAQPEPVPAPTPEPALTVYVPTKPPLSGALKLTVEYEGPPAFIRLSVDGRAKAASNMSHFTYVWDTRLEPDGDHLLRIAAVDSAERTLDHLEASLETANGNLPLR